MNYSSEVDLLYPSKFEYHAVNTLEEAIELLEKYDNSKVIAGGQSLIPMMKLRIVSLDHLIDINKVPGLERIERRNNDVVIGSLTRMAEIEKSGLLRKSLEIVSECAEQIADPLVRNLGTIGGNIAHADPSNDMPAVVLATNARIVCISKNGERTINPEEFFVDTFQTALEHDEVVREIIFSLQKGYSGSYLKMERPAGDFGVAGVAVWLSREGERFKDCRIALSSVGPKSIFAKEASESLKDARIEQRVIRKAAEIAGNESKPTSDIRGTEQFKRRVVSILTEKAIKTALKRAGER